MRNQPDHIFKTDLFHPQELRFAGLKGINRAKLLAGSIAFIILTVGIFWYQFDKIQPSDTIPRWDSLQWKYLLLLLMCLPIDALACGLRIRVVCRVFKAGAGFWTCLKAECANLGISILTPSQSGGGFGQIYMLSRGGINVGTALTISLITFLGSMACLLSVGIYALLIARIRIVGPFFSGAVGFFTLILAILIFSLIWPGLFRFAVKKIDSVFRQINYFFGSILTKKVRGRDTTEQKHYRMSRPAARLANLIDIYQKDARRFLKMGKCRFAIVCLLSMVFIVARCLMAFLCLRFLGINASTLGHILELQLALIFLIYFAPTPGGTAVAESISLVILAGILPDGFAPYYHLLWRGTTLYIPAIVGLIWIVHAIMQDIRGLVGKAKSAKNSLNVKPAVDRPRPRQARLYSDPKNNTLSGYGGPDGDVTESARY